MGCRQSKNKESVRDESGESKQLSTTNAIEIQEIGQSHTILENTEPVSKPADSSITKPPIDVFVDNVYAALNEYLNPSSETQKYTITKHCTKGILDNSQMVAVDALDKKITPDATGKALILRTQVSYNTLFSCKASDGSGVRFLYIWGRSTDEWDMCAPIHSPSGTQEQCCFVPLNSPTPPSESVVKSQLESMNSVGFLDDIFLWHVTSISKPADSFKLYQGTEDTEKCYWGIGENGYVIITPDETNSVTLLYLIDGIQFIQAALRQYLDDTATGGSRFEIEIIKSSENQKMRQIGRNQVGSNFSKQKKKMLTKVSRSVIAPDLTTRILTYDTSVRPAYTLFLCTDTSSQTDGKVTSLFLYAWASIVNDRVTWNISAPYSDKDDSFVKCLLVEVTDAVNSNDPVDGIADTLEANIGHGRGANIHTMFHWLRTNDNKNFEVCTLDQTRYWGRRNRSTANVRLLLDSAASSRAHLEFLLNV